jgi:hypothetical protein
MGKFSSYPSHYCRDYAAVLLPISMRLEIGGQLVADLAFHDLAQRRVFRRKLFERLNQRTVATLELLHPQRDQIDQNIRVIDHLERTFDVFVSHN